MTVVVVVVVVIEGKETNDDVASDSKKETKREASTKEKERKKAFHTFSLFLSFCLLLIIKRVEYGELFSIYSPYVYDLVALSLRRSFSFLF